MKRALTPGLKASLFMAISHAGTYEPKKVLSKLRGALNRNEEETLSGFLAWVHTNNRQFGRLNIDDTFAEFRRSAK